MAGMGLVGYAATLVLGLRLLGLVVAQGPVVEFGGFFSADALSAWMVLLISTVSLGTSIYAARYFKRELAADALSLGQVREFFVLTPLFSAGMFLVVLAN